jgi:Coenzyme PQQ synthesis protein D (PqqD)
MQAIELLEPTEPCPRQISPVPLSLAHFIRNPDLVSRDVAGETVVVPICRGVGDLDAIFTFNGVGSHLWRLLADGRTEAELSTFIAERFSIGANQAQSDVRNFLADLHEAGLVRTV